MAPLPSLSRQITAVPIVGAWDWPAMRAWIAARAIAGVEVVEQDGYVRTAIVDGQPAIVQVLAQPDHVAVQVMAAVAVDTCEVARRVTQVLDLERDVSVMRARLGHDAWLASLLARHAALRVPGGWDPFELAVRAILGQQVTIAAARQLAAQLVAICGTRLPMAFDVPGLTAMFPTAVQLAEADLSALRMPGTRRATLMSLARAAAVDDNLLRADASLDEAIARLRTVKGIGEWTAHYIALRALRHPDAFPASDIGLLRGAAREAGKRPTPAALLRRAETWRPYRAYAAQLLWAEDASS